MSKMRGKYIKEENRGGYFICVYNKEGSAGRGEDSLSIIHYYYYNYTLM